MPNNWKNDYTRYKDFFLNILRIYRARPDLKSFLEIILSLVTILVFSLFAIKPTILTIIELNKEIQGNEETVIKLKQKIKNLQTASSFLQEKSTDLPFIYQAVPSSASLEKSMGQIQGHAILSSVQVLGVSFTEVELFGEKTTKKTKQEGLPQSAGEVPITISVTGNYQGLFSFLKNIEDLRRPVKVDSFTINSSRTEGKTVLVMVITGRLPYINGK